MSFIFDKIIYSTIYSFRIFSIIFRRLWQHANNASLISPSYLIIQLGSNDLGKGKSCGLIIDIKRDIGRTRLLLPNTRLIWSEILMRRYWHVTKGDGK
jgi:hypothetical protein